MQPEQNPHVKMEHISSCLSSEPLAGCREAVLSTSFKARGTIVSQVGLGLSGPKALGLSAGQGCSVAVASS